jgi:hypothetical protein
MTQLRWSLALPVLLCALGAAGCAPNILGASQVGGADPATWVYVHTDDRGENGVFRCHDTPQGPVCQKAKMSY